MKFPLRPLMSRIIVKRKDVVKTSGGIFIPQTSVGMIATEGKVLAVGDECDYVKVGDNIYFGKYSGAECERNKEQFIMMNEEDVLAIIEEKEN